MKNYTRGIQLARKVARDHNQLELLPNNSRGQRRGTVKRGVGAVADLHGSPSPRVGSRPRAAEFFAGIGLVRMSLDAAGIEVVWANDIEPSKWAMYEAHFGPAAAEHYVRGDVRLVEGDDIPDVDVATASFPCTDLSLAGNRAGLAGAQSGMFWEFARVLDEMGTARRPRVVLLENVPGFATSHGGRDLHAALARLNELGYVCDILAIDARLFVPQSRVRMFIVGTQGRIAESSTEIDDAVRPIWVRNFLEQHPCLDTQRFDLPAIRPVASSLSDVVEKLSPSDERWWTGQRLDAFVTALPRLHRSRLDLLQRSGSTAWRTAYRRTRAGECVWEVRADEIAGCLRTARGGSSKQALLEVAPDAIRARWMTPREYAALQGAPEFRFDGSVTDNKALYGFGDAVCVPVIRWLTEHYLLPALQECRSLAYA